MITLSKALLEKFNITHLVRPSTSCAWGCQGLSCLSLFFRANHLDLERFRQDGCHYHRVVICKSVAELQ